MVKRNVYFSRLQEAYLFPRVRRAAEAFQRAHPEAQLINLGIGDATQPIPKTIIGAFQKAVQRLGTSKGFEGYGPEGGHQSLRRRIAERFYSGKITPDEIFVSDGAKCDIGRLQVLFGSQSTMATQDPTYPVYVDTGHLIGQQTIYYLPCQPERNFFPDLQHLPQTDLIYLCFPNNPTGATATFSQLKSLVDLAKKRGSLIIYDAAYAGFINKSTYPRSIYEIEGAREVAIEVSSFSKLIGFTGVRLGWTIVPKALQYEDGRSIHKDWERLTNTFFNGASNIAQAGGLAALSDEGLSDMEELIAYYRKNGELLKKALESKGLSPHGGEHSPYLWVDLKSKNSWDLFHKILEATHLITTPGSGFGPSGEGFVRLSAFGSRSHLLEAAERIVKKWPDDL